MDKEVEKLADILMPEKNGHPEIAWDTAAALAEKVLEAGYRLPQEKAPVIKLERRRFKPDWKGYKNCIECEKNAVTRQRDADHIFFTSPSP
ncbi:MAG: hypothetical protein KKB38_20430 [Gammaproteobacteria bacterium]|nr:hypothetical protein [Gammaproteobacteria bacterium]